MTAYLQNNAAIKIGGTKLEQNSHSARALKKVTLRYAQRSYAPLDSQKISKCKLKGCLSGNL
jgi:hypothetical protein